jgi:hypothetical protein
MPGLEPHSLVLMIVLFVPRWKLSYYNLFDKSADWDNVQLVSVASALLWLDCSIKYLGLFVHETMIGEYNDEWLQFTISYDRNPQVFVKTPNIDKCIQAIKTILLKCDNYLLDDA